MLLSIDKLEETEVSSPIILLLPALWKIMSAQFADVHVSSQRKCQLNTVFSHFSAGQYLLVCTSMRMSQGIRRKERMECDICLSHILNAYFHFMHNSQIECDLLFEIHMQTFANHMQTFALFVNAPTRMKVLDRESSISKHF